MNRDRQKKWDRANMKTITFIVYKGRDDELREYAKSNGVPLNRLITNAVTAYTGIPVGKNKMKEDDVE